MRVAVAIATDLVNIKSLKFVNNLLSDFLNSICNRLTLETIK